MNRYYMAEGRIQDKKTNQQFSWGNDLCEFLNRQNEALREALRVSNNLLRMHKHIDDNKTEITETEQNIRNGQIEQNEKLLNGEG